MKDVFLYERQFNYRTIVIFTIIVIVLSVVLFKNIDYEESYINEGILTYENKLKIYCTKDDLNIIINNNKMIINRKDFAYKNVVINDVIFNEKYLFELIIDIPIKNSVVNNVIKFKIPLRKVTILKYIIQKIGGIKWEN